MKLFKDVFCDVCGKKAGVIFRTKLSDGHYLCSDCTDKIPTYAYSSVLQTYNLEMYNDFLCYIAYSNQELRPLFEETHSYYLIHVDAKHKLFYLGHRMEKDTVIYQFQNVESFDLVFDGKEFKEGILNDRVNGRILLELEMDIPSFRYEEILEKNATAKAEKALFGTKVRYGSPKGMAEFLELFLSLWKDAVLEACEEEDE